MTAEYRITDDMSGADLTEKEHFSVSFQTTGSGPFLPAEHYELIDQVAQRLMVTVSRHITVITIRRENARYTVDSGV